MLPHDAPVHGLSHTHSPAVHTPAHADEVCGLSGNTRVIVARDCVRATDTCTKHNRVALAVNLPLSKSRWGRTILRDRCCSQWPYCILASMRAHVRAPASRATNTHSPFKLQSRSVLHPLARSDGADVSLDAIAVAQHARNTAGSNSSGSAESTLPRTAIVGRCCCAHARQVQFPKDA
jgi:hypothetical protein